MGDTDAGASDPKSAASESKVQSGKPNDAPDASLADAGQTADQTSKRDASTPAKDCEDLRCEAHATCKEQDGAERCVCDDGYEDVSGDASECRDVDECDAPEDHGCDRHATCQNKDGSYTCSCRAPAYVGDGKRCECAEGFVERDGECLAPDGEACEDNLDCDSDHCVGGICCAQACTTPETDCQSVEAATCSDGKTCEYPAAEDGTTCEDGNACTSDSVCKDGQCQAGTSPTNCDDENPCTDDSCDPTLGCKNQNNDQACDDGNPCTLADQCNGGMCGSATLLDCSAQNDACNAGVCDPADGSCQKQPLADGTSCDDADSCTTTDSCSDGACVGQGNACGPSATSCTAGVPNTCACAEGFQPQPALGVCVPNNDECASNPCGANTDCLDLSNAEGDVTCSCKQGYTGDAKQGCVPMNPCQDNPCGEGRGTCTETGEGKYSCACAAGLREVAGQCVCDMQGTFAIRSHLAITWQDMDGIEDGSDSTYQWSIARQNYDATGALQMELIACGETNLDLCGTGVRLAGIAPEAYAQYVPIAVWDRAGAPSTLVQVELPAPLPGSPFKTPRYAVLQGISLTDPLGDWPATRRDVQGGSDFDGTAVNGARWLDTDQDTLFGLTTYAVGPGGTSADDPLGPIEPYGATSPVCPRGDAAAARLAYNYPPGLDGLTPRRVKRFSSANRAISELDGIINSCDDISGSIGGPEDGHVHFDIRIGSCVRADANNGDVACSSSLLDFLDANEAPNAIDSHTFSMKRVPDDITCAQVRALSF